MSTSFHWIPLIVKSCGCTLTPMSKDTRPPSYPLRLPPELRAQLEDAAKEAHRPLSSEIILRLEASLDNFDQVNKLTAKNAELKDALKQVHELTGLAQDIKTHREEIERRLAEMDKRIEKKEEAK